MNKFRENHVLEIWMLANKSLSAIDRQLFLKNSITTKIASYPMKFVEIAITVNCKVLLQEILEDVVSQHEASFEFRSKFKTYSVCTRCLTVTIENECICKAA